MAFFQRPTDYPCLLILDPQNEFETLRKRVEQTTLKSQTVARNRSGVTNVRSRCGLPVGQGVLADKANGGSWPFFCVWLCCVEELCEYPSRYCAFWWLDGFKEPFDVSDGCRVYRYI